MRWEPGGSPALPSRLAERQGPAAAGRLDCDRCGRSPHVAARQGEPPSPQSCAMTRRRCACAHDDDAQAQRSEEHTSELQSRVDLVCRLLLEKKKKQKTKKNEL